MTLTKYINYFNLIAVTILFWVYLKSIPVYYDYYLITGFVLVIWYNWETLKQLMGQRNRLNRLNYFIGILTIVFAIFLITASVGMINIALVRSDNSYATLATFYIIVAITTFFLTIRTLKLYKSS